jgi:4-alpha-glucanotransferase
MTDDAPTPDLVRLAAVHGIATEYWSFFGERVQVPASTLRAVLAAMGVDASTDAAVTASSSPRTSGCGALLPPRS